MSFILLISDFQSDSYKTGLLKSGLKQKLENIDIIDITHQIRLNNISEAAFIIRQIQPNDSQDNIIIAKVGATHRLIVYQQLLNLYILPDNGLLTMIFPNADAGSAYALNQGEEHRAVELFRANRLHELDAAGEGMVKRYRRSVQISDGMAVADCIYTDGHGNCYFNITEPEFLEFTKGRPFSIRIQHYTGHIFRDIKKHLGESDPGEALFLFSGSGYLKLQINLGNARQLFRIKDDTKIIIETQ